MMLVAPGGWLMLVFPVTVDYQRKTRVLHCVALVDVSNPMMFVN